MNDSRPVRVVHLIAPVAFGGGEALLTDLLTAERDDLSESVVTVGLAPMLADGLAAAGVRCEAIGRRTVGAERAGQRTEAMHAVGLVRPLRRLLRRERPHVVHAHGFPPSFLAAVAPPAGTRRVYTHHYERRPPGLLETRALTALFNRYDALTTPADHLTAAMNRHFPGLRHQFATVRIGLGDRFYEGRPHHRWTNLFPPDTAIGVCVGRLVATKNQALVVRALAALNDDERRGIGIVLVGDGPQREELESLVAASHLEAQVHFAGHVPRKEVPDLLASADFGLFPSTTEASSVAAAEALAAGLPVLCLDIPSMVETVGPAGMFSTSEQFAVDLVRMARTHASLRDAARQRGEDARVGVVRSAWAALYLDVTRQEAGARPAR
ncbi:MAG: hypothetical protein QOJ67_4173 [Acidimicrobiaceae bacterium]